jgi:peptide/nickel transport system ATP-binding protein
MGAIPDLETEGDRLAQIEGSMPRLDRLPEGCAFNPRCPRRFEPCATQRPGLVPVGRSYAACFLHDPAYAHLLQEAAE